MEPGSVEGVIKGLDPQAGEQQMFCVAGLPQDQAEAAWVAQAQRPATEDDVQVVVLFGRMLRRHDAQASRHAQMHEQAAGCKAEQQVFGAALDGPQGLPCKAFAEIGGDRVAQAAVTDDDGADGCADKLGGDAPAGGFDFR